MGTNLSDIVENILKQQARILHKMENQLQAKDIQIGKDTRLSYRR